MGDETPQNVMNLDLNLGPVVHTSRENESMDLNLEDWLDGNWTLARQRWRSIWRPVLFPIETSSALETSEGSVAASDRRPPPEAIKLCDNGNRYLENDIVGGKDVVKSNENEGSFFDCNICLDMASDPVVTCCGHLFCWPCIYRWLHVDSDVKECPICKGEMTTKTVTPIYGRGNPTRVVEEDSSLKIPHRPQAKRVESWRQSIQRNLFSMPMEEMIRRLRSRFNLTRDFHENSRELSNLLLNRYLSSRGLRTEQNPVLDVERSVHQEQTLSMEDKDSVSSIAAVIQSGSHTVDTAVEIESQVSLSASSSRRRRRSESSRVSDVNGLDSRAPRRRRCTRNEPRETSAE